MTAALRSLKSAGAGVRTLTRLPTMSQTGSIGLKSGLLESICRKSSKTVKIHSDLEYKNVLLIFNEKVA
jgi:hypothetical protein